MEKIKYYLDKYKLYILISLICISILGILFFMLFNKTEENIIEKEIVIEEKKEENKEITTLRVDVKGRVKKEGVYELSSDSRVIDAINKAGGLKENANTDYINLSKKLVDEMIIIIYSDDEISKFKEEEKQIIYIEYKCECPDNINDSCITKEDVVNTNGVDEVKQEEATKKEEIKENKNNEEILAIDEHLKQLVTLAKKSAQTGEREAI